MNHFNRILIIPAKTVILLYRALFHNQTMRNSCRFEPSCSHYAEQALEQHGFFKGSWLAIKRLVRCRPGIKGGYDPVPDNNGEQ